MPEELEMKPTEKSKEKASNCRKSIQYMKLLFYLLCVCALIYQLVTLVVQYSEYKTVINVKFETIKYNRLPAITVCYPRYLSMNKTALKYPEMRPAFDKYKDILKNVSKDDYYDPTIQSELSSIYDNFRSFVDNQNLTVAQHYELMFDYRFPAGSSLFLNNVTSRAMKVTMFGLRRYEDGSIDEFNTSDTNPIQSRLSNRLDYIRCSSLLL